MTTRVFLGKMPASIMKIKVASIMSNPAFKQQLNTIKDGAGFIAALDQSGGSTPKALRLYGVEETAYNNDDEMFDQVHAMRTRIITSPVFTSERVLGAILFENTLDRSIADQPSAQYLWQEKHIVPFLKVDKGLAEENNGVQVMKPMPALDSLLDKAVANGVFGTKMRSVIKVANADGIKAVVDQQFDVAKQIIAKGLVPIIEPEVDIHSETKAEAEAMLKEHVLTQLNALNDNELVMLKLTLPETDNFYKELVEHPQVVRVVALSGGYSRDEANKRCANNMGVIASFSRAFTQGLSVNQTADEFNSLMDSSIQSIYDASKC